MDIRGPDTLTKETYRSKSYESTLFECVFFSSIGSYFAVCGYPYRIDVVMAGLGRRGRASALAISRQFVDFVENTVLRYVF